MPSPLDLLLMPTPAIPVALTIGLALRKAKWGKDRTHGIAHTIAVAKQRVYGHAHGPQFVRVSSASVGSYTEAWTDEDFRTLAAIARKNSIEDPAFLLLVMASESGLKPSAANPLTNAAGNPAAVGLIQFTSVANDAIGITEAQRADMVNWSVAQQLPLVDKYFSVLPWTRAGRSYDNAAQVYEGVFAGGLMLSKGTSPETILYTKDVDGSAYDANAGFDTAGKGTITVGDLAAHLESVARGPIYQEALSRLRTVAPASRLRLSGKALWIAWGALATVAGVAAWMLGKR